MKSFGAKVLTPGLKILGIIDNLGMTDNPLFILLQLYEEGIK